MKSHEGIGAWCGVTSVPELTDSTGGLKTLKSSRGALASVFGLSGQPRSTTGGYTAAERRLWLLARETPWRENPGRGCGMKQGRKGSWQEADAERVRNPEGGARMAGAWDLPCRTCWL